MAYSRADRSMARKRYVDDGWPFRRISEETGVGKTTLQRWGQSEGWEDLRLEQERIELQSRSVLLELLDAAGRSKDPQQVYAAAHIAEMAGVEFGPRERRGPEPKKVAVILLDVLAQHHAIGPVVRSHRNEVVRLVLGEVERLQAQVELAGS